MDKLVVLINDTIVMNDIYMSSVMNDWVTLSLNISNIKNTTKTLEFRLVDKDGGNSNLSSKVWIDNVHFDMQAVSVQTKDKIDSKCSIYPNPATSYITLELNQSVNSDLTINIYNLLGEPIRTEVIKQNRQPINISDLKSGIYVVEIKSKDWIETQKLIIK
jgi:hypothetical protein